MENEIRKRLANLNLTPTREAEIFEELAQHLEDRYAELSGGGATNDEAARLTLSELIESETFPQKLRDLERSLAHAPIDLGTNRRTKILARNRLCENLPYFILIEI
jgi:hypothetical protein